VEISPLKLYLYNLIVVFDYAHAPF